MSIVGSIVHKRIDERIYGGDSGVYRVKRSRRGYESERSVFCRNRFAVIQIEHVRVERFIVLRASDL